MVQQFRYFGCDLVIYNSTSSYINASASTIKISESCSSIYSIAIGGTSTPSDGNSHFVILVFSELAALYSQFIEFLSYYGKIYVSGFQQSLHLNGVFGGYIKFISHSDTILFAQNETLLDSTTKYLMQHRKAI